MRRWVRRHACPPGPAINRPRGPGRAYHQPPRCGTQCIIDPQLAASVAKIVSPRTPGNKADEFVRPGPDHPAQAPSTPTALSPPPLRRTPGTHLGYWPTQAVGVVYRGTDAVLALRDPDVTGGRGDGGRASVAVIMARAVFPRAVEAFLSILAPAPCHGDDSRPGNTGPRGEGAEGGSASCPCFAFGDARCPSGTAPARPTEPMGHDPWDALEALRPTRPPGKEFLPGRQPGGGGLPSPGRDAPPDPLRRDSGGAGAGDGSAHPESLGAALLLCEVLRAQERLSETVAARLDLCCAWALEHVAGLFVGWVETASASAGRERERDPEAGGESKSDVELAVAAALCDAVATSLAARLTRLGLGGQMEEAQVRRPRAGKPWRRP